MKHYFSGTLNQPQPEDLIRFKSYYMNNRLFVDNVFYKRNLLLDNIPLDNTDNFHKIEEIYKLYDNPVLLSFISSRPTKGIFMPQPQPVLLPPAQPLSLPQGQPQLLQDYTIESYAQAF